MCVIEPLHHCAHHLVIRPLLRRAEDEAKSASANTTDWFGLIRAVRRLSLSGHELTFECVTRTSTAPIQRQGGGPESATDRITERFVVRSIE
jgi:hypothetical protein